MFRQLGFLARRLASSRSLLAQSNIITKMMQTYIHPCPALDSYPRSLCSNGRKLCVSLTTYSRQYLSRSVKTFRSEPCSQRSLKWLWKTLLSKILVFTSEFCPHNSQSTVIGPSVFPGQSIVLGTFLKPSSGRRPQTHILMNDSFASLIPRHWDGK
jgi:hypothetical protein